MIWNVKSLNQEFTYWLCALGQVTATLRACQKYVPPFQNKQTDRNKSLIPHEVIVKIKRNNKSSSVVDNVLSTLHTLSHSILTNPRKLRKWSFPFRRWENWGSVICAESPGHCFVLYLALEAEVLNRQKRIQCPVWPWARPLPLSALVSLSVKWGKCLDGE